jgi:hypothetical protein
MIVGFSNFIVDLAGFVFVAVFDAAALLLVAICNLLGMATLENWGMRLFPNGMPTEEAFEKIWDAQKSEKGGNLLDGDTVWKL